MRIEFLSSLKANQTLFGVELSDASIERLGDYYELVQEHNPLLHLVGPCSHAEFATRHVLESLTLIEHLLINAKFADVGTGAGLPSIPCLLVRKDLKAVLIESKEKKAKFLELAVDKLNIADRVEIINRQFEETFPGDAQFVTCRALDKFTEKLPRLLKWSKSRAILLFGGENLRESLTKNGMDFNEKLMPLSERRYLFAIGLGS
jgi:16S rRNA (guanine(527)-N(7))-methyltransferase RsmG